MNVNHPFATVPPVKRRYIRVCPKCRREHDLRTVSCSAYKKTLPPPAISPRAAFMRALLSRGRDTKREDTTHDA